MQPIHIYRSNDPDSRDFEWPDTPSFIPYMTTQGQRRVVVNTHSHVDLRLLPVPVVLTAGSGHNRDRSLAHTSQSIMLTKSCVRMLRQFLAERMPELLRLSTDAELFEESTSEHEPTRRASSSSSHLSLSPSLSRSSQADRSPDRSSEESEEGEEGSESEEGEEGSGSSSGSPSSSPPRSIPSPIVRARAALATRARAKRVIARAREREIGGGLETTHVHAHVVPVKQQREHASSARQRYPARSTVHNDRMLVV